VTSAEQCAGDGPLVGLSVVDLSTVMMGPLATQILGDLGADVVKIESFEGDVTRRIPPDPHGAMSGISLNINRNKKSIALDLKHPHGKEVVGRLLVTADVLITNMRRGALGRLGLRYEDLSEDHPRLVYCVANGFRSGSPREDHAAYDDVIQAASGVVDLNQRLTGVPNYAPMVLADKLCALTIVYSVQAALLERHRSGKGQFIEVPMADVVLAFNLVENLAARTFEPPLGDVGYARSLSRARRPWPTQDGWVCILPYSDRNWRDFFAFTDRPELGIDPAYATFADRTRGIDELYTLASTLTPVHSTAEWLSYADEMGIPATGVLDLDDVVGDSYFQPMLQTAEHPVVGDYHVISHPVRYSRTPWSLRRHSPRTGADGEDVLRSLGYTAAAVSSLVHGGVVAGSASP